MLARVSRASGQRFLHLAMKSLRTFGSKPRNSQFDLSARSGLPGLPPQAQAQTTGGVASQAAHAEVHHSVPPMQSELGATSSQMEGDTADGDLILELGAPHGQSSESAGGMEDVEPFLNSLRSEDEDASSYVKKNVGAQEEAADWRPSSFVTTRPNETKPAQDDASRLVVCSVVPQSMESQSSRRSMDSQPSRRSRDTSHSRSSLKKLISSRQMEQLFGMHMPDHSDATPSWSSRASRVSPPASVTAASATSTARGLPMPYSSRSSAPLTISSRGGSSRGVFLALPDGADIGCVFILRSSLHVRMGSELNSEDVCNLPAGTEVLLMDRDELEDGTLRACVARPPVGRCHRAAMELGLVTPLGWVSYVAKNGNSNLILADDPAALAVLEARQRRKAASDAAKAATEAARTVAKARVENRYLTREDSLPPIASARAMEAAGLLKPRPERKPLVLKPGPPRVGALTMRSGQAAVPRPNTLLGSGSASERMSQGVSVSMQLKTQQGTPKAPQATVTKRPFSSGDSRAKLSRYAWPLRGF